MNDTPAAGRLLLLVPTTSYRIGDFLDAASRLDVEVAVGSDHKHVLQEFSQGGTVTIDFTDVERGTAQIIAYDGDYRVAAIIGVDDETAIIAATASQALGLTHNPVEAIEATVNKHRLRTRLANSGLPAPQFTVLPVAQDPTQAAQASFYPVVLKPLALSASRGVIRADNAAQFTAAFHRIRNILKAAEASGEGADSILVEQYLPGVEVALEGLLNNGQLAVLALFDKPDPLEGPVFEETIYVTPSRLPAQVCDAITDTVKSAVVAIGLREGPIHAELRVNDNGVWLIEIAARSIGGHCSRALRLGAAGHLEDVIVRHAMGLAIPELAQQGPATGVMMIPTPAPGVLRQISGIEAARAENHVDEVIISIAIGEILVPVPDGNKYLGFIFASADTPQAVEMALRLAHERLVFSIEPV